MSDGHGEKRSRRREQAISALLTHPTIVEAAQAAGVSEKTIRNWLKDAAFLRDFRATRSRVVEHAIAQLQTATSRAVETLERNLTCGTPGAEIRAAATILERSVAAVELWDLAERLEQLEQTLAKEKK